LTGIIEAWPEIPEELRQAMLRMINRKD